jgi:hypothetical protein
MAIGFVMRAPGVGKAPHRHHLDEDMLRNPAALVDDVVVFDET